MRSWRMWSVLILTLWAYALLGSASVLASSEHRPEDRRQSVNHQNEVTAQSEKANNPTAFRQPFVDPPRTENSKPASKKVDWQNPEWWNSQRITTIATVAYAGVSILLLIAILRQTSIAKRTLALAQRPHIIVRQVILKPWNVESAVLQEYFTPGKPIRVQFTIANVGGTYAWIVTSGCWVWLSLIPATLPMDAPYQEPQNPVRGRLRPGESRRSATIQDNVASELVQGVIEGRVSVFVFGWVRYRDGLKIYRTTAFCRQWSSTENRFIPVRNPDYEYAD